MQTLLHTSVDVPVLIAGKGVLDELILSHKQAEHPPQKVFLSLNSWKPLVFPTFDAHTGRLPGTSCHRIESGSVDPRWKCQQGGVDFWEPDRLRWPEKRKRKGGGRGHSADPPTERSPRSSIKSGLHPAAHCSTAGRSHAGQLEGKSESCWEAAS